MDTSDYEDDSFEDEEMSGAEEEEEMEDSSSMETPKIMESHVATLDQSNDELESDLESYKKAPPAVSVRDYARQQRMQELQKMINDNKAEIRRLQGSHRRE